MRKLSSWTSKIKLNFWYKRHCVLCERESGFNHVLAPSTLEQPLQSKQSLALVELIFTVEHKENAIFPFSVGFSWSQSLPLEPLPKISSKLEFASKVNDGL